MYVHAFAKKLLENLKMTHLTENTRLPEATIQQVNYLILKINEISPEKYIKNPLPNEVTMINKIVPSVNI